MSRLPTEYEAHPRQQALDPGELLATLVGLVLMPPADRATSARYASRTRITPRT